MLCGLYVVVFDEGFVLVGYVVLYGDIFIQCVDVFDIVWGDGFGVVDELVQVIEWYFVVDLFVYIEDVGDVFVVGGMDVEWLVFFDQQFYYVVQFGFQFCWQFWVWFVEQFEVGGGEYQYFVCVVVVQQVIVLVWLQDFVLVMEVIYFFVFVLGEQVVGDVYCQLIIVMQLFDDLVVFGVVLEVIVGVDY